MSCPPDLQPENSPAADPREPRAEEVPVVDLRDFTAGDPDARARFVATLGDALKLYGFVRVKGHPVGPALVEPAYGVTRGLFSLEADAKQAYKVPGGMGQRGYTPFGAEHAKGTPTPDLKEFWHVGREVPVGHPLQGMYPPNVWPSEIPGFRDVMLTLYRSLEGAAMTLLQAIAVYMGEPVDTFTALTEGGNTILRLLHYPALDGVDVPVGAVRAAAHEDINFITLLVASTNPGLQLLRRDGVWMDVNALQGEIVADVGDMLSRVTNGLLPATTHRVVNPDDARTSRYSMPFFVHPRPTAVLRVLDQCRGPGFPPPAGDITGQAFLEERLREIGLRDM
jgi:isopenicillin N synthase-like dioxygenase